MSSPFPSEHATFGNLHVGDTSDDDPQVIESLFIETDTPPAVDQVTEQYGEPLTKPVPVTRLITGRQTFNVGDLPVQIVPADSERQQLTIRGQSWVTPTSNVDPTKDFVLMAYDKGIISLGVNSSAKTFRSGENISLDEHTGEVWFGPQSALQGAFEITWIAVTGGVQE